MDEALNSVTHGQCDARQTYGYLPSRRTSPPTDRYQIILLPHERGTRVRTTCPRLLPESGADGSRNSRVASHTL